MIRAHAILVLAFHRGFISETPPVILFVQDQLLLYQSQCFLLMPAVYFSRSSLSTKLW